MKLESLSESKFKPLTSNQMLSVKGGEDTGGGSNVVWRGEVQVPCQGQSGGVEYTTVVMTKMHYWTSDSRGEGGTCLWGEGYGWV